MGVREATLVFRDGQVQKPIAKITPTNIEIFDKYLLKNMQTIGIRIPEDKRSEFNDKKIIYLEKENHTLFIRAFKEIYCPHSMPAHLYSWQ